MSERTGKVPTVIEGHRLARACELWLRASPTATDGEYQTMIREIRDRAAECLGSNPWFAEEATRVSAMAMQEHIAELLRILGLGDHARPESPALVMQHEIIPAVRDAVEREPGEPDPDVAFLNALIDWRTMPYEKWLFGLERIRNRLLASLYWRGRRPDAASPIPNTVRQHLFAAWLAGATHENEGFDVDDLDHLEAFNRWLAQEPTP